MATQEVLVIAPRHEKILAFLSENAPKRFTARQIANTLEGSYQVTSRDLKDLHQFNHIKRYLSTKGHEFCYAVLKTSKGLALSTEMALDKPDTMPAGRIRGFLEKFSKEKWEPEVVQKSWILPHTLADLFRRACETTYGIPVGKDELEILREQLTEFRKTVIRLHVMLNQFIDGTQLAWSPDSLVGYLLEDLSASDIEDIYQQSQKVKELHERP